MKLCELRPHDRRSFELDLFLEISSLTNKLQSMYPSITRSCPSREVRRAGGYGYTNGTNLLTCSLGPPLDCVAIKRWLNVNSVTDGVDDFSKHSTLSRQTTCEMVPT